MAQRPHGLPAPGWPLGRQPANTAWAASPTKAQPTHGPQRHIGPTPLKYIPHTKKSVGWGTRTHDLGVGRKMSYHWVTSQVVFTCRSLYIYILKTCWLGLHFISEIYKLKNTLRVHLFLFNPELKVVFGFSLSYELQILCFFFPNFSKITNFHLVMFVSMLIEICWTF
jgi:hypothetical protein